MTETPQQIDFDVPCTQCSYNLRGLDRASRCPECGRFVSLSLASFYVRARERREFDEIGPVALRGLRLGAALAMTAMLLLASLFWVDPSGSTWSTTVLLPIVLGVAWLCSILGAWLLLGRRDAETRWTSGGITRGILLVHLISIFILLISERIKFDGGIKVVAFGGVMLGVIPRIGFYTACVSILDRARKPWAAMLASLCGIAMAASCCFSVPWIGLTDDNSFLLDNMPTLQGFPAALLRPALFANHRGLLFVVYAVHIAGIIVLCQTFRSLAAILREISAGTGAKSPEHHD